MLKIENYIFLVVFTYNVFMLIFKYKLFSTFEALLQIDYRYYRSIR